MHALKNKLFACLACTIILFSCSQDVDQLPEVINSKNTQATIDQFPGLGDFITGYVGNKKDKIENYAELNSGGIHPLIERIDFDRVMARLDESGQTYMAMSIRNDDPLVIQNLVVGKGIDGNYQKPMIFTYTMTEAFYQTYLSTGSLEGFEGTVHRVYLDPDQIRKNENVANMALSSTTTTNCPDQSRLGGRDQDPNTSPDENPNPGGGGGSSGAGCSYELQTVIEELEEYVTYYEEVDGQMWLTTTIVYSTKEVDKMVMTCDDDWASLSSSDNNCTNPEDGEVPVLTGCFEIIVGSKVFNSCENTFEELFPRELEAEFNISLTSCEIALAIQFPFSALKIYSNKSIAESYTVAIFGINGRNDCSDAFRHAFYNAINARDVSSSVAEIFGHAHECETPNNLYPEKEMDLHNNSIGNFIGSNNKVSDNLLAELIMNELANGSMKILTNLDANNFPQVGSELVSSSVCF